MINEILILSLIVMIPLIELRLAIPVGIMTGTLSLPYGIELSGLGLNPFIVFLIAVFFNILLGIAVFHFLWFFDEKLKKTKLAKPYLKILDRSQRKISKYVDKYGLLGLALFMGLPIPGSGVYMGSIGGFMIGMRRKDFYLATIIGVTLSGVIVTSITLLGIGLF